MSEVFIFKGIASNEIGVVMNEKWIDCLPEQHMRKSKSKEGMEPS